MKAGTYRGFVVVSCFTGESKEKKTPYYTIELLHTPTNQYIDWTQYLKDDDQAAIDRAKKSIQTLRDLGFKGQRISDMSDSKKPISELFGPPSAEIEIVIEEEEITDADGVVKLDTNGMSKTRGIVKWVNIGGSSKFDHAQSVARFNSLRFDSILATIKQNPSTGAVQPGPSTPAAASSGRPFDQGYKPSNAATFASDEIPF